MQKPRSERGCATSRTLSTLQSDFQRFIAAGCKQKNAKYYNNVIDDIILNIPIDQVSKD